MAITNLVVCELCDSVHRRQALRPREIARCARCGGELYRYRHTDLELMLALALTGLIVFVIANACPLMTLELRGARNAASLWTAVRASYDSGMVPIAFVAAATVFFFPLTQIALYLYVLLPLRAGHRPPRFAEAMHVLRMMQPWSMVEVFMLGVIVAVVKLAGVALVSAGAGLWGYAALTALMAALNSHELRELWELAQTST